MRAQWSTLFFASLLSAFTLFAADSGWAQGSTASGSTGAIESPIGKIMTTSGDVTIEHATVVAVQASLTSGPNPAKVGDFVYGGDVVQTGNDGKIGITFTDGTAFNLSPNARIALDAFVYDPKSTSNSSLFSLTKGSLTFVAGAVARSGGMKIDTPVATMGIRGTTPHIEISENGTVSFATLVEETKTAPPDARDGNQNIQPATPQQRRAASPTVAPERMSAQEAARYNRLFDMNFSICRGC
jgi:hypothetical protein